MEFEDRRYVIIPASEINNINFEQVLETNASTCRYSLDTTKTFVKYEGDMPASVTAIINKSTEYTHHQILEILNTREWSLPFEIY